MKRGDLWTLDCFVIGGMVALGAIMLLIAAADAHDWYDTECCHSQDCAPVEHVSQVPGGWQADDQFVAKNKARPSRDERYHLCKNKLTGTIICFYVPVSG